ncbi:hypothetical protein [Mycolicibacterium neworleansense]|uniref:Uncharacterized protein n=1 Tax=Mycolicibacterium neworleansense TaxID=146018 RepID=A0A0H5RKW7_9MYCO|nr:hypothetical protein [Mycolicibacterium neworleansense]MCV7361083.1 hypothetical protein [Mycolicibacterium neworleansense]CRZ14147.1 hypothetical protein BN2156_00995 [Mycolicibacterium neworleansense]
MNDNRISAIPATTVRRAPVPCRPSIRARLTARMRSGRLDAMLAVGAPIPPGSALAARAARLTSDSERAAIARVLRRCAHEATTDTILWSSRIPLHRKNIAAAEAMIDALTLRLHAPLPVDARGMARLTRVINDGLGPLYAFGHGDLAGRLGAALAAL